MPFLWAGFLREEKVKGEGFMSTPFFKRKKDAEGLWGKKREGVKKLVKVYVPASRGFLQAPKSGYYWLPLDYARKLDLLIVRR